MSSDGPKPAHKPAGSPASTGGQFAGKQGSAPASPLTPKDRTKTPDLLGALEGSLVAARAQRAAAAPTSAGSVDEFDMADRRGWARPGGPVTDAMLAQTNFSPLAWTQPGDLIIVPPTTVYDDAKELGPMGQLAGVVGQLVNARAGGRIARVSNITQFTPEGRNYEIADVAFDDGTSTRFIGTAMVLRPAGEPSDEYKATVPDTVVDDYTAGRFAASLGDQDFKLVFELKHRWAHGVTRGGGWNEGLIAGKPKPKRQRSKR